MNKLRNDPVVYPGPEVRARLHPDLAEIAGIQPRDEPRLDADPDRAVDRLVREMTNGRPEQRSEPWKDPGETPYVRIDKLTKKFGDFVAVDDVSLNIYKARSSACSAARAAARPRCCG